MSFFENTRKPVGFSGKIMVAMMNFGHSAMAAWGLHFLQPAPDAMVLDCGCGGGANIKTLLKLRASTTQPSAWKRREKSMPEPLRQDGVPCNRQVWQNCRLKRSSLMW